MYKKLKKTKHVSASTVKWSSALRLQETLELRCPKEPGLDQDWTGDWGKAGTDKDMQSPIHSRTTHSTVLSELSCASWLPLFNSSFFSSFGFFLGSITCCVSPVAPLLCGPGAGEQVLGSVVLDGGKLWRQVHTDVLVEAAQRHRRAVVEVVQAVQVLPLFGVPQQFIPA